MSPLAKFFQLMISGYQRLVSPFFPPTCRFQPTCSQYAAEAIKLHGGLTGSWLALKRIGRCHPFGGSGFDPVPGASEGPSEPRKKKAKNKV